MNAEYNSDFDPTGIEDEDLARFWDEVSILISWPLAAFISSSSGEGDESCLGAASGEVADAFLVGFRTCPMKCMLM